MARSIAPLISQHDPYDAEVAELVRMFAEFHVAYDRYTHTKVGKRVSIEEAWQRVCEGLIVVTDGGFFPCLDHEDTVC